MSHNHHDHPADASCTEGPEALDSDTHTHAHGMGGCGHDHGGERLELGFAIAALALWGAGVLASIVLDLFPALPLGVYLPGALFLISIGCGGFHPLQESWHSLKRGRFEIDFLMVVAAAGAGILGEWQEGALLLGLFSLGHALEHLAILRARRSIASLGLLRPQSAILDREGREEQVPIAQVRIGDHAILKPDSMIAVDGIVIAGESDVDQSSITGESIPVEKRGIPSFHPADPRGIDVAGEHRVYAGTLNGAGMLRVYVTRAANETTLARLMHLVTTAQTQRSATQRLTERFERVYVPIVLVGVVLLLFVGLVWKEPFGRSFYRAMAVLVAASPCALAIATPAAVLSGIARAGRSGLLFKGGGPLEALGKVQTIAFDKTGTLTRGRPTLTEILPAAGVSTEELLGSAAAVERMSPHPLARTILQAARETIGDQRIGEASQFQRLVGRGVQAMVGGQRVIVGNERLLAENHEHHPLPEALAAEVQRLKKGGRTIVIVQRGEDYLGVLGVQDVPRPRAGETIAALRRLGIRRLVMLSGDHQTVAEHIAAEVGLDEATGDLLPEDKVEIVKRLSHVQPTAMIGDGVNDAPAMAIANVSVAMGAAGSDVALETADVALMGDDLSRLPFAILLSRQASRIIRQNLWISLGMIAILVPASLAGLQLAIAIVFHEGSTLLVVLNALRLLTFAEPQLETTAKEPPIMPTRTPSI